MLKVGKMRFRITIQTPTGAQDASGQVSNTWTDLITLWAEIKTADAKDVYAAGSGFTSKITHKITIRNPLMPITTEMQVIFGTRTFIIQAASDPDELQVEMDLLCLEQNK